MSRFSLRWWLAPVSLIAVIAVMLIWLGRAPDRPAVRAADGNAFDVIVRNGIVYDGSGAKGIRADVGILFDRIAAVGNLSDANAPTIVEARGLAVAPGFINMLSWSTESLLVDGRAQGGIRQGVTTEIMGEGSSMGPLNDDMKRRLVKNQTHLKYDITWTSLAEYLQDLERRGVSPNVASFIGAATIREHVIGRENKPPTPDQLDRMRELVRREMEAGALGIGSSLIYAPGFYASTDELIELCRVAARYQGKYISHLRSEGTRLLEAVDELVRISREASLPAEIYHLKAAGRANWPKMDKVIEKVEEARRQGLQITADMYLYPAGATGLDAAIPPSAQDGGLEALLERLADPAVRPGITQDMRTPTDKWENLYLAAGSPEGVMLVSFKSPALQPLIGKTLGEIAATRRTDPVETIIDLVLEDRASPGAVYFMMSEENIRKQLKRPWVSIGSDAASMATEGVFLKSSTHPRAYGNAPRLLGKYVREERVLTLPDAIRRLTGLPATSLGLDRRGFLKPGYFADVTIFDPQTIADRATFDRPHQYSVGVRDVFVNGVRVLAAGEHTGAKPGRALWGPGKKTKG
jgi:N-acyl-D-aspartate/D-glutamate deacylase